MRDYTDALKMLTKLFGKDCQFSLATTDGLAPSVRIIDTFYEEGCFYVVTYASSKKVKEIERNKNVALCNKLHSFSGEAYNIGHPLNKANSDIREKLIDAFQAWYFKHNDEKDPLMCYLKIELKKGFFCSDELGYQIDFQTKTAKIFPFHFEPIILP